MEKNPYSLAKLGLENPALLRPQRDCGFYAKYIFLFLSLIQFLIILGLVLFMVYGDNHAATEKHLQGMSGWLQECSVAKGLLQKEKANLTHLLNASRAEGRQAQVQLGRLNATARACGAEKLKLQGQLRNAEGMVQVYRECYAFLNFYNSTYPEQVKALQADLRAKASQAELEKMTLAQENQGLKAQVKKLEQELSASQREALEIRSRVQKVGELEAKVMGEMQAARQNLRSAVEAALPSHPIWSCNSGEVKALQDTCHNLSKQLDFYIDALRQRLEERINSVARENALLQAEKVACGQELQECSRKAAAQEQRAVQEKQALQLDCSARTTQLYAEKETLFREKEVLRQKLEQMPRVFHPSNPAARPMGVPGAAVGTNPFANFPAVPVGAPNANWPRPGSILLPNAFGNAGPEGNPAVPRNAAPLGHLGAHRTSSYGGYAKPDEAKKAAGANATFPHQPVLKPAGHSSG